MLREDEAETAVDPQTGRLLEKIKPPPDSPEVAFADIGVELAREGARAVFLAYAGTPDGSCITRDLQIDGGCVPIPARLYSPPDSSDRVLPLVVFLHGGGWAMGDLDCYDGLVRALCVQSGARMLSVEFRRSPEHRFPDALNDAIQAVRWAGTRAADLAIDAARIALMGDSAGGNLAAAAARRICIDDDLALRAQFLLYPLLDLSRPHSAYPTRMAYGGGDYMLTRESIDVTLGWYLGDDGRADDPDVSPLLAPDLHRLPPTVIVAAGCDPLLDESLHYARLLRAAGVPTRFKCFERTIHAFLSFGVLDVANRARTYLSGEMKRLLF